MRVTFPILLIVSACLLGCPSDSVPTLQVDVRTDYVPQEDFDAIRIEVGGGDLQVNLDQIVNPLGDYVRGQRIGSAEVAVGDVPLAARLVRDGVVIASREVITRVSANITTATVVITRDCSGVACPDPGGDTSLRSCYGGRCADPRCTLETPEFCPVLCTSDAECESSGCRVGSCNAGVCFSVATDGECAAGLRCASEGTCVETGADAGPMDAGPMDAAADATMDAGGDTSQDSGADAVCMCPAREVCVEDACLPDLDEDGFAPPEDCADDNGNVFPGQTEICNGIDDDCDEMIDGVEACGGCIARRFGGKAYIYCELPVSWAAAASDCRARGQALVSVESAAENTFLSSRLVPDSEWWIGLNDRSSEATFVWENGSLGVYRSWAGGEPNNFMGSEDCAALHGGVDQWYDENCALPRSYICEEL